jgi:penicillin-binding protein 1A
MKKRGRDNPRVEKDSDDEGSGGLLSFGLGDSDRTVPTRRRRWWQFRRRARLRPERKSRSKPKAIGKTKAKVKRGRGGRGRGERGGVRGALGRMARVAAVLFLIGAAGLGTVVAWYASKLPPTAEWTVPKRPANVRILAADGALITNRGDSVGTSLRLDEMPPYLPQAVIAIEDRRFYWHFGIDPIGLTRALLTNWQAGGVVQGGSTITQQLAKNLFLKPERTFERKVQEVILAAWLEMKLSKDQILELYLNRVYLGAGAYGVDAAAHRYFGKSARNVTLAEAAVLAGLLKAPAHYSPVTNPAASEERAQLVLAAMRSAGFIDDRQATLALATEVKPVRDVAGGSGRYVADWVMDILPGYVGAIDEDIIVDTTIDLRLQAAAQRALSDTLAEDGARYGVGQGALVAIDEMGAVKALVGGRDYATSPFNRAIDGHRQPGSAFKPFVYLTALESGLIPESVRIDQPVTIKGWKPENYSKEYKGPVTLQAALSLSLNTVSAQLTAEVGPAAVAATARRLGISSPLQATPSIALGTSEVTPLELTAAFVPFSNGGRGVIPHVIDRIMTANGDVIYERSGGGPGQVVDPMYVAMMNSMLKETLLTGTGRRAQVAGWPAAGKTGTSQDFRDAWFIGYTRVLTAGVWFGNDNARPTKKASGSNLPAVAWNRFMSEALQGVPVAELPGDYRFRDPGNFALAGAPGPVVGEDGAPIVIAPHRDNAMSRFLQALGGGPEVGQVADANGGALDDPGYQFDGPSPPADVGGGPVPPTDVGGQPAPRQKRGNFFQRLFGGG